MNMSLETTTNMSRELTNMLSTEFTTEDQQSFLTNFKLYLAYADDPSQKVIDLDHVWGWMGFSTKGNAKRTLQKHFDLDTDYTEKQVYGGDNKETIMISVDAFKTMCMLSNSEKGKRARAYYAKMEAAMFKCFKKLNHDQTMAFIEETKKKEIEFEEKHQKTLIEAYAYKCCVYIIRVTPIINDEYVVKIGETTDIKTRIRTHAMDFDECVLLDVIPTVMAHNMEQYILKRPDIIPRRIAGTETINMDKDFTCRDLASIIKKSRDHIEMANYSGEDRLEIQKMQLISEMMQSDFDTDTKRRLIEWVTNPTPSVTMSANSQIETPSSHRVYKYTPDSLATPIETYPGLRQPRKQPAPSPALVPEPNSESEPDSNRRVYKYALDDLTAPTETFKSLREAARSTRNTSIHDYHVRDACSLHTVLENHRWVCVDKTEGNIDMTPPDSIPPPFEPPATEKRYQKKLGLIAQICPDTNAIVSVFPSVNDAAKAANLSGSSVSFSLHHTTRKAGNFFWKMWEECDEAQRGAFKGELPGLPTRRTCSKPIAQVDPKDDRVVTVHDNQQAVASKFKICAKKLNQLCDSGEVYKGFVWRRVDRKSSGTGGQST